MRSKDPKSPIYSQRKSRYHQQTHLISINIFSQFIKWKWMICIKFMRISNFCYFVTKVKNTWKALRSHFVGHSTIKVTQCSNFQNKFTIFFIFYLHIFLTIDRNIHKYVWICRIFSSSFGLRFLIYFIKRLVIVT